MATAVCESQSSETGHEASETSTCAEASGTGMPLPLGTLKTAMGKQSIIADLHGTSGFL